MPRDYRASENAKMAKAKRQIALERNELRGPGTPHVSAAGVTSAPIKARNADEDAMIEAFIKAQDLRLNGPPPAEPEPKPSEFGPGGMLENLRIRARITPKCESPIEIDLGAALIQQSSDRYETVPQFRVGRYRFDFGLVTGERLIALIECDGEEFHSTPQQIANDAAKDAAGAALGVPVFRFSGKEIYRTPQGCAAHILRALELESI